VTERTVRVPETVTPEEYQELIKGQKRGNKYHVADKADRYSEIIGRLFASKLEKRRAEYLWGLQKAGAIAGLEFQHEFILSRDPKVSYRSDFYYDAGLPQMVIEDTKGMMTPASRVKLAWMRSLGNPVTIIKDGDW